MLTCATRFLPTWAAVAANSAFFGAGNANNPYIPFQDRTGKVFHHTCLGLVLGYSYVRSRNLIVPILIHSVCNLVSTSWWLMKRYEEHIQSAHRLHTEPPSETAARIVLWYTGLRR